MVGSLALRHCGRQCLYQRCTTRWLSQRVTSQNSMNTSVASMNSVQRTQGASNQAGTLQHQQDEDYSTPLYSSHVSSVEENLMQVLRLQRTSFDEPNHLYESTVRGLVSLSEESQLWLSDPAATKGSNNFWFIIFIFTCYKWRSSRTMAWPMIQGWMPQEK